MADATHTSPPLTARRLRRALWWFLGLVLIAVAVLATAIAVLLSIERAQHWQLSKVPGLAIEVPQGLLTRGPFNAKRLVVQAGNRQITLHDVKWNDLRWQWRPYPGAWLGITIDAPRIGRVEIGATTTPAATALQPPASLRTNVAIHIKDAHIGELLIAGTTPLKQLRLTMALGDQHGAVHRIESASAQTDRASVALSGAVATDSPFALEAQAQLASTDETASPWQGQVQLKGPLETIDAAIKLTSRRTGQARVDGTVQLTPFAEWPLSNVRLEVDQLNLASLDAELPQTLLNGQISVATTARDSPVHARVTLTNAKPGRWDAHALPIESLTLQAQGLVSDRNRLQLPQFEAVLHQGAGTVRGSGQWQGHTAELTLQIDGLRPAALDARAAKLAASGSSTLTINGLPTPEGQWPTCRRST
jgi:translocation and assembly module TamB